MKSKNKKKTPKTQLGCWNSEQGCFFQMFTTDVQQKKTWLFFIGWFWPEVIYSIMIGKS